MINKSIALDYSSYGVGYITAKANMFSRYILGIALLILLFSIPYLVFLFGSGNPESIKKGRQYLESLIGGILIVLLAYSIINVIGTDLFGV